ncbi:protein translocase subunit SecD [Gudongella oleilytica]|jgi:preprotein translocase subunit SecD|uniref:protein translocase subunit SecD n=1 Tax=Gudongella oleilytica TaxID=1582259 RepID=UPI002A3687E8|nr:protein translocase subunit SecD [Gudongella oleilytica]MDY0256923.1 protein translocase subunit SecD [Gudongella oleilytica]
MRTRSISIVAAIIITVIFASYIGMNGLVLGDKTIRSAKDSIELGLDLAGGVYVVLEANTEATGDELAQMMEETKAIIGKRVDGLGVSEPNIAIEGENRIRVELAGVQAPDQAIDLIGKTALLEFKTPAGDTVITGKNVINSQVLFQPNEYGVNEPVVSLELNEEGRQSFFEATSVLAAKTETLDKIIYIVLDGEIISNPMVLEPIIDGKPVITGMYTLDEANDLSNLIRAGALPVEMVELQTSVIGPTLGLEAFEKSILAGGIVIAVIFAFMLLVYRVPGFVASLALTIYVLLVVGAMILIGAKLTLPGIAGLVLSIGMAVDANILIFERIREEILVGKTVRVSIDAGFKRALRSILDSNITTLIAGAVLYFYGTGPIKGFGVTLTIGIVASMITAVFFTKYVLRLMAVITGGKNLKLYGV